MFWICHEDNVDNTEMFWLLLSTAQHQGLFCFSPVLPASGLAVHRKLGGVTGDPNWPKGISVLCDAIPSNQSQGEKFARTVVARAGWASVGWWQAVMEDFFASPIFFLILLFLVSFSHFLNCCYLSPWIFYFLPFPFSSHSCWEKDVNDWLGHA